MQRRHRLSLDRGEFVERLLQRAALPFEFAAAPDELTVRMTREGKIFARLLASDGARAAFTRILEKRR